MEKWCTRNKSLILYGLAGVLTRFSTAHSRQNSPSAPPLAPRRQTRKILEAGPSCLRRQVPSMSLAPSNIIKGYLGGFPARSPTAFVACFCQRLYRPARKSTALHRPARALHAPCTLSGQGLRGAGNHPSGKPMRCDRGSSSS